MADHFDMSSAGTTSYDVFTAPVKHQKYHGLLNQGSTCYLNSVLQVLFMTKDFRKALKGHSSKTPCIDSPLAALFDDLQKYTGYTYNITKHLDIDKVYVQGDAAECFEKILSRLTTSEASRIFQGHLTYKNKCTSCGNETSTNDPFWSLPLKLEENDQKDYSVVGGIDTYFTASDVSGPNQLYCDDCNAKTDATIKFEMRHHPEVLTLLLKRFKFDYKYKKYMKLKCSVEIPYTLQIPKDHTYELYAFVEHFGELRDGHYTATIKSQDDEQWYNFNDTIVTQLHHQPFQVHDTKRSQSAYLLFYRKMPAGYNRKMSTPGASELDTRNTKKQRAERPEREREEGEEAAVSLVNVGRQKADERRALYVRGDKAEGIRDVGAGKQRDEEKMETGVKEEGQSRTGADRGEQAYDSKKLSRKYDIFGNLIETRGVGGSKLNTSKNIQEDKQVVSSGKGHRGDGGNQQGKQNDHQEGRKGSSDTSRCGFSGSFEDRKRQERGDMRDDEHAQIGMSERHRGEHAKDQDKK